MGKCKVFKPLFPIEKHRIAVSLLNWLVSSANKYKPPNTSQI